MQAQILQRARKGAIRGIITGGNEAIRGRDRDQQSGVSKSDRNEINSPSGQAKLLQLAPSFASHKLALQSAKGIAAAAFDVGLVVLGISDPGKHLIREDIPAQGGNFSLNFGNYAKRKKHCAAFN